MQQKLVLALATLALSAAPAALGQPSQVWENWGSFDASTSTPIDALTFINHPGAFFSFSGDANLFTSDTVNYTNQGTMSITPGMGFVTRPSSGAPDQMAANFVNLNGGLMDFSGFGAFATGPIRFFFLGLVTGNSECIVNATNILNQGAINMNASSLIQLNGNSINLSHGSLSMTNPTTIGFFGAGILDGYWGVGNANADYFKNPPVGDASLLFPLDLTLGISQVYNITNRNWIALINEMVLPNATFYINDTGIVQSNRFVQAVALVNTNAAFSNTVYFGANAIGVQWQWASTNLLTHQVNPANYLSLLDTFGEITNLQVVVNGEKNPQAPYPALTYQPFNYNFFFGQPIVGAPPADPTVPAPDVFGQGVVTNQYSAYEAIVTAASQLTTDVAGGNVTNTTGRIELNSTGTLNLNQARISSLNYLKLNCTNHFLGSSRAQIASPWMDLNLATTNGTITVTNLVLPYLDHPEGTIQLYSARWTNFANNATNIFHVLFVDSEMSPVTLQRVQSMHLSVTNSSIGDKSIVINDALNITSDMLFDAQRLTIASNSANAVVSLGEINLLNSDIVWSTATRGLQYLTNNGVITTENAVYFGGSRTQPPFNTNIVDVPYAAFVNHGVVTNFADLIWATYFENSGLFDSLSGSIVLNNCSQANLNNGTFLSAAGDVSLTANSITLSNTTIQAGGAIDLSATTLLDDGSLTHSVNTIAKNFWTVFNGINLLTLPASSSLLATTITNTDLSFSEIISTWAGADLGCSPAGFNNNAAIGQLVLDGQDPDSQFTFAPASGNNAIYIDLLELKNSATNRDASGDFSNITIEPGMKVYFAQAMANGVSIAEKLNGKNGGAFCWVTTYAGFYSGTNVVYPDGVTNRLNTALVTSCDIDSNGNGIVNCADPAPVFVPSSLGLKVAMTNRPSMTAMVSWNSMRGATNYLYCAPSSNPTNWILITNFVSNVSGRVTVADPMQSNKVRFYKARVDAP